MASSRRASSGMDGVAARVIMPFNTSTRSSACIQHTPQGARAGVFSQLVFKRGQRGRGGGFEAVPLRRKLLTKSRVTTCVCAQNRLLVLLLPRTRSA